MVDAHFSDIIQFLTMGVAPAEYLVQQKKELVTHTVEFTIIAGHFYKLGANEVLRRYVLEHERQAILA